MSEKKDHKIQIWVAVIGLVGAIAAAVISNWDKLTPNKNISNASQGYSKTTSNNSSDEVKSITNKLNNLAYKGDLAGLKALATEKNINVAGNNGSTPLMSAVWNGKTEATRLLIEKGANPLIENDGNNDSITQAICNNKILSNINKDKKY